MSDLTSRPAVASAAVRLSPRGWAVAVLISVVACALLPALSGVGGAFSPGPDFRLPDRLSEDYWLFRHYSALAAGRGRTLVLGDSVAWGRFVTPATTLTHYLNAHAGGIRFANLAVNGAHPVALGGLLEHHGAAIANRDVVLVLNLSWLSSRAGDLREDKETRVNHPRLVPQFFPRIACYRQSLSGRLGVVAERHIPVFAWARHVASVQFENLGLQEWTLQHPYSPPFLSHTADLLATEDNLHPGGRPWHAERGQRRSIAWVDPATSLQWRACRQLANLLRSRGNRVLVVVTPLNEHMMDRDSLATYTRIVRIVESWLQANGVAFHAPAVLPSDLYADLSHPLAGGYETLARDILAAAGADRRVRPSAGDGHD